ncbi:AcrIF11 family anti-CRISPR ADP-ribosyltransferase [Klebsiella oxytoca]|uniref:hypothetical protein n=1 Tax=Klebsiella oxytoca TaxID=571 RepID=UPI00195B5390|nr:hypothetical protein [Klebsiella oxytoca]QRS18173.1 hypothetical protein I6K64_12715 [Klebsiella oxytoca]
MKLFHGSYESESPVIKIGAYAMTGDNVFDGIFASDDAEIAGSHGRFVHTYSVENVADNVILNERIDDVIAFLRAELECDDVEALAYALADDECDDSFAYMLSPRSCTGDAGWEMQRLRGRVAAHLGFDAVEMEDEHGTSYLIVNPKIIAE